MDKVSDLNDLESLGLLSNPVNPALVKKYDWMSEMEQGLLFKVFLAGEDGLHKRVVTKELKEDPLLLTRLEAYNLVKWERDLNGRLMFLVITWKGSEVGDQLLRKAKAENHRTCKARRH